MSGAGSLDPPYCTLKCDSAGSACPVLYVWNWFLGPGSGSASPVGLASGPAAAFGKGGSFCREQSVLGNRSQTNSELYEIPLFSLSVPSKQNTSTLPAMDKNSSMELAVISGNFGCSDLACSDLAHNDLAHFDLGCFFVSKFLLFSLNIHNLGTHLAHTQMEQI